jgi:hypothetical protein
MGKKASFKGKKQYGTYKTENRIYKNKLRTLINHCKRNPNDEQAREQLEKLKKSGVTPRKAPRNSGEHAADSYTYQFNPAPGYLHIPKTAGEQLSELLNIPIPKAPRRRKKKPGVSYRKKKRNVRKT